MEEKDSVSLWKQPEILLICSLLCKHFCNVSLSAVSTLSEHVSDVFSLWLYIPIPGIPQGAIIHENSSICGF